MPRFIGNFVDYYIVELKDGGNCDADNCRNARLPKRERQCEMQRHRFANYEHFQRWVQKTYTYHDIFFLGEGRHSSCTINFNVKKIQNSRKEHAAFAVKYYPQKHVLVAWDLKRRRECGGTQNFTLNQEWEEIAPNKYTVHVDYHTFKGNGVEYWDKTVIIGEHYFESFFENCDYWMAFNTEDATCPNTLSNSDSNIWPSERARKKYSVLQRQRDARFHHAVLEAYGYQCAICRTGIEEVLQAAHLHGFEVADTDLDADKAEHGICLCANHHLMYDRRLIDIDIVHGTICIHDDNIKNMPWYSEFQKYDYKLVERKKEK